MDCQQLKFDNELSQKRIQQAVSILGERVVGRFLAFALYLLGVRRSTVAETVDMPVETLKTFIKAVLRDGISALEDRRRRASSRRPQPAAVSQPSVQLSRQDECISVDLVGGGHLMEIPTHNRLQLRSVLLSMFNSGLVSARAVADQIGVSSVHVRNMAHKLSEGDVNALIDKREGQKQDYLVTSGVKGELIQQFTVDLLVHGQTSGRKLSEELRRRRGITVADRTVRYHVSNLGLNQIKETLPDLFDTVKKTSKPGV